MKLSEYVTYDGLGLAELVRRREVTPAELAETAFRAMDAVNDKLNAVVGRVDPPVQASDVGDDAPFRGVPFVVKDLWHGWGGVLCEQASNLGQGYIEPEDGPLAARFKKAGLVLVGRGNTCELGLSGQAQSRRHGTTRNPWDLSLAPGGSSGGSAAAVAAGIVPLAHGNDGGGSIRMPPAYCGLVGLKPSRGRNPLVAPAEGDGLHGVVAHHVMSRTVRDNAAALDATSGPTGADYIPLAKPGRNFLAEVSRDPGRLRIALCTRVIGATEPDPRCVAAATSAAKLCEELGHHVAEAVPDITYSDIIDVCMDSYTLSVVHSIEAMAKATGRLPGPETLEPPAVSTLKMGYAMTAAHMAKRLAQQHQMCRTMARFMSAYDIVLTPATSMMAPPVGQWSASSYGAGDLSYWAQEGECYTFLPLFSVTGQPALVLPHYLTPEGLPVGIQIASAIGEDGVLYRLAGQLERARPWIDRRPPVHAGNYD